MSGKRASDFPEISGVSVSCYTVPTASAESDGTFAWTKTTMVLVELEAGEIRALGYSYADLSTAKFVEEHFKSELLGKSAVDIPSLHAAMIHAIRNLGRPGVASMAISAVDIALWDLKAKILGCSLSALLGATRDAAPVYGSGGFTSYTDKKLQQQLGGWAREGFPAVKMKIGREPLRDEARVRLARKAIGKNVDLFVDANGAYSRRQALALAEKFADSGVSWFEEPRPADDLDGLHFVRERAPAAQKIAAGEYGYQLDYFRRMLEAGAVDVLQADATRCGGITGFLEAGALAAAFDIPFSFHCAPTVHAAAACALPGFMIGEYFFDHARIEKMFFDGIPGLKAGALKPDPNRPGLGIDFKRADATKFAA